MGRKKNIEYETKEKWKERRRWREKKEFRKEERISRKRQKKSTKKDDGWKMERKEDKNVGSGTKGLLDVIILYYLLLLLLVFKIRNCQ